MKLSKNCNFYTVYVKLFFFIMEGNFIKICYKFFELLEET